MEENPDEVLAALDDKTEAVIRELEAQHKEARAVTEQSLAWMFEHHIDWNSRTARDERVA